MSDAKVIARLVLLFIVLIIVVLLTVQYNFDKEMFWHIIFMK